MYRLNWFSLVLLLQTFNAFQIPNSQIFQFPANDNYIVSNKMVYDSFDQTVYIVGYTLVDMDGQSRSAIFSNSQACSFITKRTLSGGLIWTRLSGGIQANGAYVDPDDHSVYQVGETMASFDGQSRIGNEDAFITKWFPNGTRHWTRFCGASRQTNYFMDATTITVQNYNNQKIVVGMGVGLLCRYYTNGTEIFTSTGGRFNLGTQNYAMVMGVPNYFYVASNDGWIAKYDAYSLARLNYYSDPQIALNAIRYHEPTNSIISGGWATAGYGPRPVNGSYDAIAVQYSLTLQPLQYFQFGSVGEDFINDIRVDVKGKIFMSGYCTGPIGNEVFLGGPTYNADGFVASISSAMVWKGVRLFGTPQDDFGGSMVVDVGNNVYVEGDYGGYAGYVTLYNTDINSLLGDPAYVVYVWTGNAYKNGSDYLTTLSLTWNPTTAQFDTTFQKATFVNVSGNEPHHLGLNVNNNVLIAGGLLSFMNKGYDTYFFSLTDKYNPTLASSISLPNSAVSDATAALPDGGFVMTLMGNRTGQAPGRLARFAANGTLIAEYPNTAQPPPGFNPHGLAFSPRTDYMYTGDFVEPASLLLANPGPNFRNTIQVWSVSSFSIIKTINVNPAGSPPCGLMDVSIIAGKEPYALATCVVSNTFVYVDPIAGTATPVNIKDAATGLISQSLPTGGSPHILLLNRAGTRAFISDNALGLIYYFDITDPKNVILLSKVGGPSTDPRIGPHMMFLTPDEQYLVITDYFLKLGSGGRVNAPADNRIWMAKVNGGNMTYFQKLSYDFLNPNVAGVPPGNPHGLVVV